MPNSCVRCSTAYDITPRRYQCRAQRKPPSTAKGGKQHQRKPLPRNRIAQQVDPSKAGWRSGGLYRVTGSFARTDGANASGSPAGTHHQPDALSPFPQCQLVDRPWSGEIQVDTIHLYGRQQHRLLHARLGGPAGVVTPASSAFPIGSSPGPRPARPSDWLTTATGRGGIGHLCFIETLRPLISRMPIVWKVISANRRERPALGNWSGGIAGLPADYEVRVPV